MKMRILRWLLAIAAWVFCAVLFASVMGGDGGYAGVAPLLIAFGALIGGIVLVSSDVVTPIAGWFADRLVDVIQPGARLDKPPLSYLLAHRYRDQMRFAEAIQEYENIIHYYPGERAAYEELLGVAAMAGDTRTLERFRRKYLRRFRAQNPSLPAS